MGHVINCPECKTDGKILLGASSTCYERCWLCLGSGRLDTYPMPKPPDPEYVRLQRALESRLGQSSEGK